MELKDWVDFYRLYYTIENAVKLAIKKMFPNATPEECEKMQIKYEEEQ